MNRIKDFFYPYMVIVILIRPIQITNRRIQITLDRVFLYYLEIAKTFAKLFS